MSYFNWKRIAVVAISASIIVDVVSFLYKLVIRRKPRLTEEVRVLLQEYGYEVKRETREQSYQDVLFFPDKGIVCPSFRKSDHISDGKKSCRISNCPYLHKVTSLMVLENLLRTVKRSISICVYVFACHELAELIVEAHSKGVCVRIIINNDQRESDSTEMCLSAGIPIRWNRDDLMHHKFVILDNSTLVMGSFNWSTAAVIGNNENLIVSMETGLISAFGQEFEKLWKEFDCSTLDSLQI